MRILIADEQFKVRRALYVLLTRQPGLDVVGEASSSEELLSQASTTGTDLALVDWDLPGCTETGWMAALRTACPNLRIVALSGRPGVRHAALAAGVDAFVSKSDPPEVLLTHVRRLMGSVISGGIDVSAQ